MSETKPHFRWRHCEDPSPDWSVWTVNGERFIVSKPSKKRSIDERILGFFKTRKRRASR